MEGLDPSPTININFDFSCAREFRQSWIPWSNKNASVPHNHSSCHLLCVTWHSAFPHFFFFFQLDQPEPIPQLKPISHSLLFFVHLPHSILCFTGVDIILESGGGLTAYLFCILHHTKHIQDNCFINIYWTQLFLAEKRESSISVSYGGPRATMISSFMLPTTVPCEICQPSQTTCPHGVDGLLQPAPQCRGFVFINTNLVFAKQETERL